MGSGHLTHKLIKEHAYQYSMESTNIETLASDIAVAVDDLKSEVYCMRAALETVIAEAQSGLEELECL